jgi:hypothetical protein
MQFQVNAWMDATGIRVHRAWSRDLTRLASPGRGLREGLYRGMYLNVVTAGYGTRLKTVAN